MRVVRLLLAAAAVAGAVGTSAPAQAEPCVDQHPVVWACVLPASWYRGAVVGFYEAGPLGAAGFYLVGEGCYYPGGQPRYFVHVYTPVAERTVIAPVGGVPCV